MHLTQPGLRIDYRRPVTVPPHHTTPQQRVPPPPGKRSNNGTTPAGIQELKGLSEAPPSMYRFGSANFASPLAVDRADSVPSLPLRSKTLVIYPPACLRHETMNHQENKDRLR